jgi:holo-[acyl-carrier protein] synthase
MKVGVLGEIFGIGTDIVEIERIGDILGRFGERFVRRILTPEEFHEFQASKFPSRLLAKRFAAKEAVAKAMGLGFREGLAFSSIGITHDENGKPEVAYKDRALALVRALGITGSLISISDERHYAVAFAILTRASSLSALDGTRAQV